MLMLPAMQSLLVYVTVVRKLHAFCKQTKYAYELSSVYAVTMP